MTPATTLTTALHDAADPILLVDGEGQIVWYNRNAELLLPSSLQESNVASLFGARFLGAIRSTELLQTVAVTVDPGVQLAALIVDVSSGAPGIRHYLLTLQSTVPMAEQLARREEHIATISHDLKNPLGAIFGYADALLESALGGDLSARSREIVLRIRSTATRALELVRNLQLVSQIRSAHATRATFGIDLTTVTHAVIESLWRPSSTERTIVERLSERPVTVGVDRFQLERLIANLVTNALKYSPERGIITVTVSPLPAGGGVLSVHNTGSFIPEGEIGDLFQRYERSSLSGAISGSGLGLFIVKTIVDGAGGSIEVVSSLSEGTTFVVRFPPIAGAPDAAASQ